jgi:integrase
MRASEARHLKWEFWDPHTSTFFLDHTKTGTTRKAMVSKELAAHRIDDWRIMLDDYYGGYRSPWVIPDLKFPLQPAGYNSIAVKLREVVSMELGFNVNSKTFRSTLVQLMRDSGASFEHIAAVVGHRDIGVTQKYYSRIKLDNHAETAYMKAINDIIKSTNLE